MTVPAITIVCATYQRRDLVERQARALLAQRVDGDVEVVIVDNGSTDGTRELLADLELADATGRLRVLRLDDNRGPARARNLGWRTARGPLVAFTDDDCEAAPGWAAALLAAAQGNELDIVQGRTLPHPDELHSSSPWSKSQRIEEFSWRFETCNLAVRRELLERLDGFDERFGLAAGEDTDVGWRARDLGARMGYAEDALVHHTVWPRTFTGFLRERQRWADLVLLPRRHPDVRELYFARYFYRPAHAAVVGLAVSVPLCVAAGVWWLPVAGVLALIGGRAARGGGVRRAAEGFVAAAWETVVFARASARHRSLLL